MMKAMRNQLHLILKLLKDKNGFTPPFLQDSVSVGKERAGFTLPEMLFVISLIVILMVAIYPYLRVTHRAWKTTDRRQEVIQNARVGMEKMIRLLREATGFTSVTAATDADGRIIFSLLDDDDNTVTVEFKKYNDGTNDMLGYVTGSTTYALAGPIESLKFTCYEEDGTTTTTTAANIKSVKIDLVTSDSEGEVGSQTIICRAFSRKDMPAAIVVSEIMYYPCDDVGSDKEREFEWLEVYNNGSNSVDLDGWQIEDGGGGTDTISAYGGSSTLLSAGEYAVIGTSDTKVFDGLNIATNIKLKTNDNRFGADGLGNSSDTVLLKNSSGIEVDSVSYSSSWGGGYSSGNSYSLERVDPSGSSDDSDNWAENESEDPNAAVTLGSGKNQITVSFYCTPGAENSVSE